MSRYGEYGRPILLFEAFIDWREQVQSGAIQLEEAWSKADFADFLYGPVRQSLWNGYSRIQGQYRRYGRVESMPDFRERRLRGLNGVTGLARIGDHGEYPMMRRSTRPPASLVIDTYGGIYSITRQAIINDETGALLSQNPEEMGWTAGRLVTETIIATIEDPNLKGPDGNAFFQTGVNQTTAALSEDTLADAITAMENQLDDDGNHIVVRPTTLAVKTARMELIARRIIQSAETGTNLHYDTPAAGTGTNVFDKGRLNPLMGILPADSVVRDPYWSDSNNWYLFSDPGDVPGFAIGFLNGQEAPFIGLKDPGVRSALDASSDPYSFPYDTVDFKVRLDFGCAPVDPRGVYRGTPA